MWLLFTPAALAGTTTSFESGSLIIPMDESYQDDGMLEAYGLVYLLLLNDLEIHWMIASGKSHGDDDFTATAYDIDSASSTAASIDYRGGPFVIDSGDAAEALTVIASWRGSHTTTVHEASLSFTGEVDRTLRYAPSVAIFADGREDIAFDILNAAGIPDSNDSTWPSGSDKDCNYATDGYPDVLCYSDIEGSSDTSIDGALFDADGYPEYCHLDSMHYNESSIDGLIQELREFMVWPEGTVLNQCAAIESIENNTAYGLMLSDAGLSKVSRTTASRSSTMARIWPWLSSTETGRPLAAASQGSSLTAATTPIRQCSFREKTTAETLRTLPFMAGSMVTRRAGRSSS